MSWGAAVADGVGGGPAGDLASASIVHRLAAGRLFVADEEELVAAVRGANWELRAQTHRDPGLRGMATTLTGLVADVTGRLLLMHSGDSRAYRLRSGVLSRQTRDDSLVQALVDSGVIAPEEASHHPRRNIVTASLGGGEADALAVVQADAAPGDRWLLCSDGVSDYLPEPLIAQLLSTGSVHEAALSLVDAALTAGTHDNVTAVVCDVEDGDADRREAPVFSGAAGARFSERLDDVS